MSDITSLHQDAKNGQGSQNIAPATSGEQAFTVEGASCASCVTKIETAIKQVPGVTRAEMNFAQGMVTITGTADSAAIIGAVEKAGYGARPVNTESEDSALEEKEHAERAYYKRLMREMTIALALGVPLMIYSHFAGEMTVSTNTERLAWLIVGLLTLGVMVYSGKHFYVGAWRSFLNHAANPAAELRFMRKDASPCSEIEQIPYQEINESPPLNKTKSRHLPPVEKGQYEFYRQMQMYRGVIHVE